MIATLGTDMGFKENLRRLRAARGWSQDQAAREVGVPVRSYVNWELGIREPRMGAIVQLATAFEVTTDELLEGVAEETATEAPPETPRRKGKKK